MPLWRRGTRIPARAAAKPLVLWAASGVCSALAAVLLASRSHYLQFSTSRQQPDTTSTGNVGGRWPAPPPAAGVRRPRQMGCEDGVPGSHSQHDAAVPRVTMVKDAKELV
ncbi:unnamed protein product [Urochloa humidicola]